jgi:hypothetical protein
MVLFRHFILVLDLVIARQLLLQGSPIILLSKWSRINRRFLFCLTFREVNSDLSKVFEWSLANFFKLNPSESLPIYRNHLLGPLPALFLVEDFIPFVFKAKNLGVTFSYNLT